jgi:glycosyltransferase involved in cell wall biosynthesis
MSADETSERTTVVLCVGTYRRNDALAALLESVLVAADHAHEVAAVGAVVVDDNPDGSAKEVIERYRERFELGIEYRHVGRGNISLVRNEGIEAGIARAEWLAMTDDDCVVSPEWITELLAMQRSTGVDVVTGLCVLRAAEGSPSWLTEQPFLEEGPLAFDHGDDIDVAATHNSLISSAWLRAHPMQRFDPRLGVIGGEDMVFFRSAHALGMRIRFSTTAVLWGIESLARATMRYRVRAAFWMGNTTAITNLELKRATRRRIAVRGLKTSVLGAGRPLARLARRQSPQLRYSATRVVQGVGQMVGAAGIRHRHH